MPTISDVAAPAAPAPSTAPRTWLDYARDTVESFDALADPGKWLRGAKVQSEALLLTAIGQRAHTALNKLRSGDALKMLQAGDLAAVWFEMFLERVFDQAAEVRQPSGKYTAFAHINLRFVSEVCALARVHLDAFQTAHAARDAARVEVAEVADTAESFDEDAF